MVLLSVDCGASTDSTSFFPARALQFPQAVRCRMHIATQNPVLL